MNQAVTFKCPNCGAYLEFDPAKRSFTCPFCAGSFSEQELKAQSAEKEQKTQEAAAAGAGLRTYHCQTCGAEAVTTDTTAATRCYYCHSPIVLSDRLGEDFRPDGVVPFQLTRAEAEEKFEQYLAKKHFVDRRFFDQSQRENISGVYYPYWFADIDGHAAFDGEGRRINVVTGAKETITTTRIYRVEREADVSLRNMVRQALRANDRQLSDGIHPYDLSQMEPFSMGYLSGFLAEKRDVESGEVKGDLVSEAAGHAESMIKTKRGSFDSLSGNAKFEPKQVSMRYCLLPTWVLTYRGDKPGKTFYFMMNGQTGQTCGRLPINWGKLAMVSAIAGAAVSALLAAGGALLW